MEFLTLPKVSVTTRTADSLSDDDIIKCLETNVDIKNDEGYKTWIGGGLQDEDYNSVDGSFTYTLLNADSYSNPIQVNDGYVTAYGSKAGTYTVEIKGSQNDNESITFTKHISITVKALPDAVYSDDGVALTYTATNGASADIANANQDGGITTQLYATYNNLFAGYVRVQDGEVTVACNATNGGYAGNGVIPKGTTLTVGSTVTYGSTTNDDGKYENTVTLTWGDSGEYSATATYTTDTQLTNMNGSWTVGSVTSDLVKGSKISLTYEASEGDSLASGSYTFEITSITTGETVGATVKTPGFSAKVTNSLVLPKVNVTTRTADSLSSDDIIKCLETNVDMNNNDSLHESIDGVWYKDGNGDYQKGANEGASGSTATIGYVEVYDTVGNVEWHFFFKKAAAGPHVDMGIPNTQKLILRTELLIHNLIFCKSF